MAYQNVTTATTVQVSGPCRKIMITVNNGWTGTITVIDNTTGSTPLIGTITNPVTGNFFEYFNISTGARITTTGTVGDITVNTDGSYGGN